MVTNHVYTVAGAKGGVGKTTTGINLGAVLASAGYRTVTVELDLAMANVVDFLDLDVDVSEATTVHDVLAGDTPVEEAVYTTGSGLSVVPSGTDLTGYANTDLGRLPDVLETLRWHHDVVLLDTPAGLSEETVRPLGLSDELLLVSTPRVSSVRNAKNTLELAGEVDTDVRGLVLTKSGTGSSPGADRIAEFLGVELLGHVPEDDAVPHAQDRGVPVVADAPRSGAAAAYRRIGPQLVGADPDGGTWPPSTAGRSDDAPRDEEGTASSPTGVAADSDDAAVPPVDEDTGVNAADDGPADGADYPIATNGGTPRTTGRSDRATTGSRHRDSGPDDSETRTDSRGSDRSAAETDPGSGSTESETSSGRDGGEADAAGAGDGETHSDDDTPTARDREQSSNDGRNESVATRIRSLFGL